MRILHLSSGNLFGGIETFLVTLARFRQMCPEMEPHFGVCFEGRLAAELRSADCIVHNFGAVRFSRPWTLWFARRRFRQLLAKERYDAVITHACWPHCVFASVARKAKVRVVFFAHDLVHLDHWLDRKAARQPPAKVIANSKWIAAGVDTMFPGVPVEAIYHPVTLPQRGRERRDELRQELETPRDAVVILMTARMEAWKGHRLLLQALAELRPEPRWVCWIAGGAQRPAEQEYLRELRRQESELGLVGRVRWLGQRSDIPDLLPAADIHSQPNLRPEPFGIAFIEALFAGLPVVTTRFGAAPEIIDPSCGILVEPENPKKLALALLNLIADETLRKKLGEQAPERARQLCDPKRQIDLLRQSIAAGGACNGPLMPHS